MIVLGEPASKANQRRLVLKGGRPMFIKSAKALAYAENFKSQAETQRPESLMEGDLSFIARIYYASRRPDLDESLILDLLQGIVYANDRQVKEKHVYWGLDKHNPRTELTIKQMP